MAILPEDLIPVKTLSELMDSVKTRLRDMAFRITNWRTGGVFYTLMQMANQGLEDLYTLLKSIAPQMYLDTATGQWLDFKAAEYEVYRKPAQKTQGNVVFGRNAIGENVVIPVDSIGATLIDRYGERLKFGVITQTVLEVGNLEVSVPCEAEFAGDLYNIGSGQITELLTNIAGIDYIRNDEGWITREGTDEESDESLRARAKGKWSQLSTGGGRDAYVAWAQEITGVVVVQVDDNHPRGQGTVDVIVTGTAGLPTQNLVDQVQAYLDIKKPVCTDVLAVAPTPLAVNYEAVIYIHPQLGDTALVQSEAEEIINIMHDLGDDSDVIKVSTEFGISRAQITANLMAIENTLNINLIQPAADVVPGVRELPVKGTVTITVQRVS